MLEATIQQDGWQLSPCNGVDDRVHLIPCRQHTVKTFFPSLRSENPTTNGTSAARNTEIRSDTFSIRGTIWGWDGKTNGKHHDKQYAKAHLAPKHTNTQHSHQTPNTNERTTAHPPPTTNTVAAYKAATAHIGTPHCSQNDAQHHEHGIGGPGKSTHPPQHKDTARPPNTNQRCTTLCCAVLRCVVLSCVQCCDVLCCAVLCAALCCNVPWCAMLCFALFCATPWRPCGCAKHFAWSDRFCAPPSGQHLCGLMHA